MLTRSAGYRKHDDQDRDGCEGTYGLPLVHDVTERKGERPVPGGKLMLCKSTFKISLRVGMERRGTGSLDRLVR